MAGEKVGRPKGVADEDDTFGWMVSVDVFGEEMISSLTDKPLTVTAFPDSIIGRELSLAAKEEFGTFSLSVVVSRESAGVTLSMGETGSDAVDDVAVGELVGAVVPGNNDGACV